MASIYSHYGQNNGCFAHRVMWPFRYCGSQDFPGHRFDLSLTDPHKPYDAYHLYNTLTASTIQCCGEWKRKGGKLVTNWDDALGYIPEWNGTHLESDAMAWLEVAKDISDLIICSTPALAEYTKRPTKTVVARNLLEVAEYRTTTPNPVADKFRILWAGSKTHTGDLDLLEPVIDTILTKYSSKQVEFVFVGAAPGGTIKNWLNRGVHLEPGTTLAIYPELLSVIKPQLVLAPLVDCEFNRAKSAIRVMEAGALACPVVTSPVGEYAHWVEDGVTGYYAETTEDWVAAIEELISNTTLREQMGTAARAKVGEEGDWANPKCRLEWRAAFQRIVDLCN